MDTSALVRIDLPPLTCEFDTIVALSGRNQLRAVVEEVRVERDAAEASTQAKSEFLANIPPREELILIHARADIEKVEITFTAL